MAHVTNEMDVGTMCHEKALIRENRLVLLFSQNHTRKNVFISMGSMLRMKQTLQSQELLQWETKPVLISFGGR